MNLRNTFNLGVKELRGLWRDPVMLVLIVYSFSLSIWTSANVSPEALTNAAISIVDEDQSHLSARITSDPARDYTARGAPDRPAARSRPGSPPHIPKPRRTRSAGYSRRR